MKAGWRAGLLAGVVGTLGAFLLVDFVAVRTLMLRWDPTTYSSIFALNQNGQLVAKGEFESKCVVAPFGDGAVRAMNAEPLPRVEFAYKDGRDFCDREECVPPMVTIYDRVVPMIRAAPAIKTAVCLVRKNASRIAALLMCLFEDPERFFADGNDLIGSAFNNTCKSTPQNTFGTVDELPKAAEWRVAMIVREPLDRLLSAFLFHCVQGYAVPRSCGHFCAGCGPNIT
ncbi:hypothetical protein M3Y99_00749800 [Aphelenchoides fujianensis]|nr:hypothetical protein M3Y99_00749800 [Aphelenchoides fujianensis]